LRTKPTSALDSITQLEIMQLFGLSLAKMTINKLANRPVTLLKSEAQYSQSFGQAQGTQVLTNPAERIASQGGTVDWFRFWLKAEEDPDPTKAEQYTRWRELRKLQKENEKKLPAPAN
jgi:hypothetical protein